MRRYSGEDVIVSGSSDWATCEGCGLIIDGGFAGCLVLYQRTLVLSGALPTHVGLGRLAFDTYSVQHPNRYCISAKSLAAHLGGLCWGLEHGGDPRGYEYLRRSLDGPGRFPKPALPSHRGTLTIADVATGDEASQAPRVEAWARATWAAYADLQDWARARVRIALG